MFCGKCGTRLSAAPARPNPYSAPVQHMNVNQPTAVPSPTTPAQPYGGYVPPQRPAYPRATPDEPTSAYTQPPQAPPVRASYPSHSESMMQSPYISGASRSSAPVLSSSREGAAQYTAVSTNVYSAQARDAALASNKETKKKKVGGIILTVISVLLLGAVAAMIYFSGLFEPSDNSIVIPESSGTSQPVVTDPVEKDDPIISESDTVSSSDSTETESDSDITETPDDNTSDSVSPGVPGNLDRNDLSSVNAFVSAFTEIGFNELSSSVSTNQLMEFAVLSLSMNSNVYSSDSFSYGSTDYGYSIPADVVSAYVSRYFGGSVQIFPATGDSGNGWIYYNNKYYFTEKPESKGFALITDYSSSGDMADVKFNIYSSSGNDSDYYGMAAAEAEAAGCTLIGTGTATLGKTVYNGRNTFVIQSIQSSLD